MRKIYLHKYVGDFAEDKDVASTLRNSNIIPEIENGGMVVLDFTGVDFATQSFMHALLSQCFRDFGADFLDFVKFEGCGPQIRSVISVVCEYMQDD